jgi:hypothetical protein
LLRFRLPASRLRLPCLRCLWRIDTVASFNAM